MVSTRKQGGIGRFLLAFFLIFLPVPAAYAADPSPDVLLLRYHGIINPASEQYLSLGLEKAEKEHDAALILEMDTPGGLDHSMRFMVKKILASPLPVILYVAPSGSRCGSACVFLVYASSLSAMSSGTNIGAAHPVDLLGGKPDKTMARKIENDAVAYIGSLAKKRGRNIRWAEDSVKNSVSIGADQALKKGVVEIVASRLPDLLRQSEGRMVPTASGEDILHLSKARVDFFPLPPTLVIMKILSHPQVAYLLMLLGFWGLVFELSSPGGVFPGVFGGICLIVSIYAFGLFPYHLSGILLSVLGLIFLLLEIKVPSYGVLTAGGLLSLILGGILLGKGYPPYFQIPTATIIGVSVVTTMFLGFIVRTSYRSLHLHPSTGTEALAGQEAVTLTAIDPDGEVRFQGENWSACSDEKIDPDQTVLITGIDGLRLHVQRKNEVI